MKLGTKNKVTFDKAYRDLIGSRKLSKIKLNYSLLSNEKVMDDRFAYQRQINLKKGENNGETKLL